MRTATLDVYAADRVAVAEETSFELLGDGGGLVPADARLERVAGGFEFTEGPVWTRDGALLFSSPNTNAIYRWNPVGRVDVFRPKSGYTGADIGRYHQPGSNGLTLSPDGRLTICQHGNRRVIRVNPHGDTTVLADSLRRQAAEQPERPRLPRGRHPLLHRPAVRATRPVENRSSGSAASHSAKDGVVELVTDELEGPNGLAFSPDERYLYVGNWDFDRTVVMRYDLAAGTSDVFFDMTGAPGDDAIDGMKVDREGNLYVCGPGGIWLLTPAGEHLGTLRPPESPHNLAWGDEDGRTLYITALTSIYRIRLSVPGIRPE